MHGSKGDHTSLNGKKKKTIHRETSLCCWNYDVLAETITVVAQKYLGRRIQCWVYNVQSGPG